MSSDNEMQAKRFSEQIEAMADAMQRSIQQLSHDEREIEKPSEK